MIEGTATEVDTPSDITLDDVKDALNRHAASNGQAATRAVMQAAGGALRLMDVAPAKYRELVAALNKGVTAQKAAA